MKVVTLCLPQRYVTGIEDLVEQSKYPNRSEAIRIAIRDLLVDELWGTRTQKRTSAPLVSQLQESSSEEEISSP
ncbi:MAG: ribbon-helix-helix domain-containing protein [Candidatus Thorarchaeota archaeon]